MITALSALPLLLAASPAPNEPGATAEGDAEWLELDRELAALTAVPAAQDEDLMRLIFDVLVSFQRSDDAFYDVGGDDLSGIELRRARMVATGAVADYTYFISSDLESGAAVLQDAYVGWRCSELVHLTAGRYKTPLLWSARTLYWLDLFHDPTITATETGSRDNGFLLDLELGDFEGLVSVQNGVDGAADEQLIVGRLQWDMIGESAFGEHHGAYGYEPGLHASVAGGVMDDGAISNGTAVSGEFAVVVDAFSLRGDVVQYDEAYDEDTGLDPDDVTGTSKADRSPSSLTFGYMLGEDEWELLARLESFDDPLDSNRASLGIVRYTDLGPRLRWSLLYQEMSSDDPTLDGSRVELSLFLRTP